MRHSLWLAVVLLACSGKTRVVAGGDRDSGGGAGGVDGADGTCTNRIDATEAQNYSFANNLMLSVSEARPDSNLVFDWSRITEDWLGRELTPTAVDRVDLALWSLSPGEFLAAVRSDTLGGGDFKSIVNLATGNTLDRANLLDFTASGEPLEPELLWSLVSGETYASNDFTYTVFLGDGNDLGEGIRLIHAFVLNRESTNETVTLTNDSATLLWDAELEALARPGIPAGTADVVIDWSRLSSNAMGFSFNPLAVSEVRVARFSRSIPELEAQFLDLEVLADETWSADASEVERLNLSTLEGASGSAFAGIDERNTWLLALICKQCRVRAPVYLTVLKAC